MVKESNPGWAAGIGQSRPLKRIAWALQGAPPRKKDLRLNAMGGIAEARKLRDRISARMTEAGEHPEDAIVVCIFAEPDLSAPVKDFCELGIQNGASDIALAARHPDKLPIGFLVFVLDRNDPQHPILGHARPLIVEDPRAIEHMALALRVAEQAFKRRLMETGAIPDTSN